MYVYILFLYKMEKNLLVLWVIDHPLLLRIEITSRHADKEYFFSYMVSRL